MNSEKSILKTSLLFTCLIFILLMMAVLFVISYQDNSKATAINNNYSPSELVTLFWNASFQGDDGFVNRVITKEPKSFSEQACKSENNSGSFIKGEEVLPESSDYQKTQDKSEKIRSVKSSNEGIFSKYYNKNSEYFSIYGTSHIININKYPAQNLVIENEFIYADAARVDLFYKDPYTGKKVLDSSVFLKKELDGWKIFLILDKKSLNVFDNKNYGKTKPLCENQ